MNNTIKNTLFAIHPISLFLVSLVFGVLMIFVFYWYDAANGGSLLGALVGVFTFVILNNLTIMLKGLKPLQYWISWLLFFVLTALLLLLSKFVAKISIWDFPEFVEIFKLIVAGNLLLGIISILIKKLMTSFDNEVW